MLSQRNSGVENEKVLKKILSNPDACTPHIHLSGPPACGILESLKRLQQDLSNARLIFINSQAVEGCSKILLSQISKGFEMEIRKCDNILNLQQQLNQLCEGTNKRMVCVLLESQALNAFTSSFLKAFFDIAKKTPNNRLSFVSVSHLSWQEFQREINSCASEPVSLYFRLPTTEETIQAISHLEEIPVTFVKNCVDHLTPTSNNPNVVKNLVKYAWSKSDKEEWNKKSGLEKYLKYLDDNKFTARTEWLDSSSSLLSAASKLVLVACYCASHNHPASDKRYLIKTHNKEKVKANQKANESSGVPKMFDLERLLFIREALIQLYPDLQNDSVGIEPKLLVNSLVSMNRVILVSSDENIDWPKLKCVTPFETIRQLANDIGISDINIHLEV